MREILERLKRIILAIISFGLIKYENPESIGPYLIDSMKQKLADLKASAVPVIANQYRIERMLEVEEKKLAGLDADARAAVTQNQDDLAGSLLLQRESSQERVDDLKLQLEAARQHAVEAKQQVEMFQEELGQAADRVRNAQMRYQLATMRAQVQKFAMSPTLDSDMRALERMEEKADQTYAEAQAITDVAALSEDAKRRQVHQASRKMRADQALSDLKAEMGISKAPEAKPETETKSSEGVEPKQEDMEPPIPGQGPTEQQAG